MPDDIWITFTLALGLFGSDVRALVRDGVCRKLYMWAERPYGRQSYFYLPEKGDIAPADLCGMNLNLKPPCHRGILHDLEPWCA